MQTLEIEAPACGAEDHPADGHTTIGEAALERAANILRAAGEVGRLRLLEVLLGGERCVTDLAEAVGVGLSTVSQQLRVLRAEDLVIARRKGKHVFYSLADQHVVELINGVLEHAREGQ